MTTTTEDDPTRGQGATTIDDTCAFPSTGTDPRPPGGPDAATWPLGRPDHPAPDRPGEDDPTRETARAGAPSAGPSEPRGRGFDDYELIRVLGRGGAGVVYLARQISLDRPVAVKMLRVGALASVEEVRRFRIEAETIARFDHPNLLKIFEVGEHAGGCFFSMPVIGGGSLADDPSRFLDDPARAARMVAEIARAVQHAHRRGVLHRDLKPANILVDEDDRPYVGDFGLARRIDAKETLTGSVVGTPAFMSPEQASGDRDAVTTASDVYGLGAILYVLLTGLNPFSGYSVLEILRRVCDQAPEPPSKANPRVDRGLEAICLKCLEKEPGRRYASAEALADDLARWIEGRPVMARPVGPLARGLMWCRRKPALAGMALALAASIVAGTVGILGNWLAVRHQRKLLAAANEQVGRERDLARALNGFLVNDILRLAAPSVASGRPLTLEDLLDRAASGIAWRFYGRPAELASIRRVLAETYLIAGRLDKADKQLKASLEAMDAMPDVAPRERLAAWHTKAGLLLAEGHASEAMDYASRTFEGRRDLLGPRDADSLDSANLLASVHLALGNADQAELLLDEALRTARDALGEVHQITLASLANRATVAYKRRALDDAEAMFRTVQDQLIRVFGRDHPNTLAASSNLGAVVLDRDRPADAEELLGPAFEGASKILGERHPLTLTLANNLAVARNKLGKFPEAGEALAAVVRGRESTSGATHLDTLLAKNNLAANRLDLGEYAEALVLLGDVLPRLRVELPSGDPGLANAILNHANALQGVGKLDGAEREAEEAIALNRARPGRAVDAKDRLASILIDARAFDRAEAIARGVLEARTRPGEAGGRPWKAASARSMLGAALAGQGDYPEAEPLLLDGYEGMRADPRAAPAEVARAIGRIASMYEASMRPGEAARWRARLGGPAGR